MLRKNTVTVKRNKPKKPKQQISVQQLWDYFHGVGLYKDANEIETYLKVMNYYGLRPTGIRESNGNFVSF
jgi:hypothetical protein